MSIYEIARAQIADLPRPGASRAPRAGLRDAELEVDLAATLARLERHDEQRERPSVTPPQQLENDLRAFIARLGLRFFSADEVIALAARVHTTGAKNELPPRNLWGNLALALRYADEIRSTSGSPGILTSLYRAPAYNAAVGGARRSLHLSAAATDISPRTVTPRQWGDVARSLRGRPFSIPVALTATNGLDDLPRGLAISVSVDPTTRVEETVFTVGSGIGVYRNFTHTDVRGSNQSW